MTQPKDYIYVQAVPLAPGEIDAVEVASAAKPPQPSNFDSIIDRVKALSAAAPDEITAEARERASKIR